MEEEELEEEVEEPKVEIDEDDSDNGNATTAEVKEGEMVTTPTIMMAVMSTTIMTMVTKNLYLV
jgi:hypothetical protein